MQYLDPIQQKPKAEAQAIPASGAGKYHGDIAEGYDAKRINDPKWTCEQRIIEGMLSDLPKGSTILDCPVGTGRFLDFYVSKGFKFVGADLSGDMLIQSALKILPQETVEKWVEQCNAQGGRVIPLRIKDRGELVQGDVREIGLEDKSVDAACMIRLTRWLSPEDCQKAMRQLQRVCRSRIIWTARVANHKHARSRALFESALDGWRITHAEPGHELDYVVFQGRPA